MKSYSMSDVFQRIYGAQLHPLIPGLAKVVDLVRSLDFYISARTFLVVTEMSMPVIVDALRSDGKYILMMPVRRRAVFMPDGSTLRERKIPRGLKMRIDAIIAGCHCYNQDGEIFIQYAKPIDMLDVLERSGCVHSGTVRIAAASISQQRNGFQRPSRLLFRADAIITPERGVIFHERKNEQLDGIEVKS